MSFLFRVVMTIVVAALAAGMIQLGRCEWMPQGQDSLGAALQWIGLTTLLTSWLMVLGDADLREYAWRVPFIFCVIGFLRMFFRWIVW